MGVAEGQSGVGCESDSKWNRHWCGNNNNAGVENLHPTQNGEPNAENLVLCGVRMDINTNLDLRKREYSSLLYL